MNNGNSKSFQLITRTMCCGYNLIAGMQIHLLPGFKVINGGKFHGKIEDMGECKTRDGIYDIFNLPYNSAYMALNNTGDTTTQQLKSLKNLPANSDTNAIENIISILPNPTTGIVFINYNNNVPFKVEIANVLGESIYTANFVTNNNEVDLTQYGKGVYPYKIIVDNQVIMSDKLVIIK